MDFVEVEGAVFWMNLVDGDTCDRFITPIVHFIECKGSFTSIYYQLCSFRLEVPWNLVFSIAHELYLVLAIDIHLVISHSVVLGMCRHCEAHSLADHIVKWH